MSTPTPVERPTPLTALATWLGPALGALSGLVGFLIPFGLANQAQVDTINSTVGAFGSGVSAALATGGSSLTLWAAIASGLIAALATGGGVFAHARLGRRYVTPLSDPRDNAGRRLLPEPAPALMHPDADPLGHEPGHHERPDDGGPL